jgi:hypothetical protein
MTESFSCAQLDTRRRAAISTTGGRRRRRRRRERRERRRRGGEERERVKERKTVVEFEFAHTSHTTIEVAEDRNIFENDHDIQP